MNTFQKVMKNMITSLLVTMGICGIALVIEIGIFFADWFHTEHNFSALLPWGKENTQTVTSGSITAYSGIDSISVDCADYDLSIAVDSSIEQIQVSYLSNNGNVSVGTDNGTLIIRQRKSYNLYTLFKNRDVIETPGIIYVQVPKDFSLDSLTLSVEDGDSTLGKLAVKQLDLSTGKGAFVASYTYADNATIHTGDGSTIFENVTFDKATVTGGDGDIGFSGHLYSSGNFHIGDGNLTLLVYASRDYYGLSISKGDGDIFIDGDNYENVPLEESGSHNIFLENQKGNCNLIFQPQEDNTVSRK